MEAEDQLAILRQFKANVADVIIPEKDTDALMLKYLKVRNYNLKKTERYFREWHAFKKMYEIDTSFHTYQIPEPAEKYEFTAILGNAKDGSLIRYSAIGKGDYIGFLKSMSAYDLSLYGTHLMERDMARQREYNKKMGIKMNEITYIFDCQGLSLQDFMHKGILETGLDMMFLVQDYYPEVWGHLFFVNAPPYFDLGFNLFKPILRMNVIRKMKVISREETAGVLLKYIDEDVLPVFLGGNRVDSEGDSRCSEFLRFGGTIPERYYLCSNPSLELKGEGIQEVWVPPRSYHDHIFQVTKPGTRIRIQLKTHDGSIYLRIMLRGEDQAKDELSERKLFLISPPMRIQAHISPVDNTCLAPWTGTYIYRFSNSYSLFYSRRTIFRITVIEPEI